MGFYIAAFFGIISLVKYLRKIFLAFLIALLAGLFGIFIYNMSLFFPERERGSFELDGYISSMEESAEGMSLRLDFPAVYISKLSFSVEDKASISPRIELRLWTDEGEELIYSDINPYYFDEETLNIRRDGITALEISTMGCTVADIRIQNVPSFNIFVFLFGGAAGLCLSLLVIFAPLIFKRPQIAFAIIALLLGGAMCICLPRDKVGYDEEEHLKGILGMVMWPGDELRLSDTIYNQLSVNEFSTPIVSPGSKEEMTAFDAFISGSGDYVNGARSFSYDTLINRAPAYLAMALMMKAAMLMGLPWALVLLISRLANLLFYTLLMYLAIDRAPVGKWLLFIIGLFPQNLFMAATFSYDPFVTGCLFCGMAFMLRLFNGPSDRESTKDLVLAALFIFLGCLPKAVYAPLILMLWAPSIAAFFSKKRRRLSVMERVMLLMPVLIFAVLVASFILPTVLSPSEGGDVRGGATSEVSQVGYILSNPIAYARLLIWQIISWFGKCFIGPDCSTFMGNIVSGLTEFKGFYRTFYLLLLSACFMEPAVRGYKLSLSVMERIWIFLMCGASVVLIWTSMYVAFTVPGASEIAGVQGRYFIPLLFPLYLILSDLPLRAYQRLRGGHGETGAASEEASAKPDDEAAFGALESPLKQEEGLQPMDDGEGGEQSPVLESHLSLWYYLMMILPAMLLIFTIGGSVLPRFCL